jgi:hypothetical protein
LSGQQKTGEFSRLRAIQLNPFKRMLDALFDNIHSALDKVPAIVVDRQDKQWVSLS